MAGREEEKIFAGELFAPGDPELVAIKLRSHLLCQEYSATREDETQRRAALLEEIFDQIGEGSRIQGPLFVHYGKHTRIGKRFFGNYDLTIQDDGLVTIGDDCDFGTGVTIVTPLHPLVPEERFRVLDREGRPARLCYARPVTIGSGVWLGANVTVCPGVTIGDGAVIGAGSVVTRDIPPRVVAVGNPCRVLREITEADSIACHPEIAGGCAPLDPAEAAKFR